MGDVVPGPLKGVFLRVPKGSIDGIIVRWWEEKRCILMRLVWVFVFVDGSCDWAAYLP